jgi:integrase
MSAPSFVVLVTEYLALRRSLGFALKSGGWVLLAFARHLDEIGHCGPLTVDVATRWAASSESTDPCAAARRLAFVRQFARHLLAFEPATEVPPAGLLGRDAIRKPPHIYSDAEIAELLREARLLQPRDGLRPLTYVAFFALLASTGLRLAEARRLTRRDVDLKDSLLVVREGKCRKSRLVPLHASTVTALAHYAARRDRARHAPRSEFFFRTDREGALSHHAVEKTFHVLRRRLKWCVGDRARRPHIHDLRHTFAVRRLLRWYEEGADVDRKVLALATYLGHTKVSGTYWYLSAVPELMSVTSRRFELFAGGGEERVS